MTDAAVWDRKHVLHPWEGTAGLGQGDRSLMEQADGIYVQDSEGRRLIDGPGGMWCVQIGYGRREMAQAMADQATRLAYYSPFNNGSPVAAELAQKIAERSPGDLNRVFFTTGGSTAVDTAIRFVQFRNNLMGRPTKKRIISRERAYHGSTYLSASVSARERDKLWMDKSDLGHFLPEVTPSRRPKGQTEAAFLDEKVADLEQAILTLGPETVAAFIAEPIQASGGVIVPPKGYHARCLEVCRRHDVLYIADEVVTGFGRLGHWFASEDVFGMVPDILVCAKGLTSGYAPMGATLISDRLIQDVTAHDATFANGFTYSGHPVSAAAGLKNIEIFEREDILGHVRAVTPVFQARLKDLSDLPQVAETRGMGLVGCVECGLTGDLAQDRAIGAKVDAACQARGLIVRPNVNMCVLSPPLTITEAQIHRLFDILRDGILAATA